LDDTSPDSETVRLRISLPSSIDLDGLAERFKKRCLFDYAMRYVLCALRHSVWNANSFMDATTATHPRYKV
jgi:hypothetical protein